MKKITARFFSILILVAFAFTNIELISGDLFSHAAIPKKPAQVQNLKTLSSTTSSVTLKWSKVKTKGLKGYAVYCYNAKTKKWKLLKRVNAKTLKYIDKKLKEGTAYKYKVRAFSSYRQYYNTKTKKWVNKKPKAKQWKTKKTRTKYVYGKYSTVLSVKTKNIKTGDKNVSKLSLATLRAEEFAQVNKQRTSNGVRKLKRSSELDKLAQEKAEDMYNLRELSHNSKNLGNIKTQLINAGIADMSCGENIQQGATTVKSAINTWMNSPGHRNNILDKYYTHIGFGYYKGYWVQQFAENPVHSYMIECPYCGSEDWEVANYYYLTTEDQDGNIIKIWNCSSCGKMNYLCPLCKKDAMVPSGINQNGSTVSKCKNCGHSDSKFIMEKCESCGAKVLNNTEEDEFTLRFEKGTHFQEIGISLDYCKSCKKYVLAGAYEIESYQKQKEILQSKLDSGEDVFDFITWWKMTPGETVQHEGGWSSTEMIRNPMDTPRINSLEELYKRARL